MGHSDKKHRRELVMRLESMAFSWRRRSGPGKVQVWLLLPQSREERHPRALRCLESWARRVWKWAVFTGGCHLSPGPVCGPGDASCAKVDVSTGPSFALTNRRPGGGCHLLCYYERLQATLGQLLDLVPRCWHQSLPHLTLPGCFINTGQLILPTRLGRERAGISPPRSRLHFVRADGWWLSRVRFPQVTVARSGPGSVHQCLRRWQGTPRGDIAMQDRRWGPQPWLTREIYKQHTTLLFFLYTIGNVLKPDAQLV